MTASSPVVVSTDELQAVEPAPLRLALWRIVTCMVVTVGLILRRRLHQPNAMVGKRRAFADGTTAVVYRETVVAGLPPREPVVLVVEFRMWLLNGQRGQAYFRWISELNTVLFAGFSGFANKLWMAADQRGRYRGLYEWDGAGQAEDYVSMLWWPLAVISHPNSIRYRVLPAHCRHDILTDSDRDEINASWPKHISIERSSEA